MNDKEYMDALTGALSRSLEEAQPLVQLTPERIEALARHAEQRQAERKRRRTTVLTRWSMAASVALLVGIGAALTRRTGLPACPTEEGVLVAEAEIPVPAPGRIGVPAPRRIGVPACPRMEGVPPSHEIRPKEAELAAKAATAGETPAILGQAGSLTSMPSVLPVPSAVIDLTPSAVIELDEASYEMLLAECWVQPEPPKEEPLYAWGDQLKQSMVDFGRELLCTKFHLCNNTD